MLRSSIGLSLFFIALVACQSTTSVRDSYQRRLGREGTSSQTAIVFMIDGLSSPVLNRSLEAKDIPAIDLYFGKPSVNHFRQARASFPTLTYPNLTSILTGHSVSHHPVIGNRVLGGDQEVNFENFANWTKLERIVDEQTVFHELSRRHETSVSFSYPFPRGATAHQQKSLAAGLNYAQGQYGDVDTDTIVSLEAFLRGTEVSQWPRFIFVHLIGVDSIAHELGPDDPRLLGYLRALDHQLGPIFQLLAQGEAQGRAVQALFTSDHGFVSIKHKVSLSSALGLRRADLRIVEDNRIASLYLPRAMSSLERSQLATEILSIHHMDRVAFKSVGGIDVYYQSGLRARIDYQLEACQGRPAARFRWITQLDESMPFSCLSGFDKPVSRANENYIVPALVEYFLSPTSPDMIALPDAQSDFTGEYLGNHGGLTEQEMLVPILTRNVELPSRRPPTSSVLKLLELAD